MYNHKMIHSKWNDDGPSDGLNAMFEAINYYQDTSKPEKFEKIIRYNEIDCKVMWDIVKYLRSRIIT